jgi:hypothetical protein
MKDREHTTPEERAEADDQERIDDLEVPKGQAGDVAGGAGTSGGDILTENISLNAKK